MDTQDSKHGLGLSKHRLEFLVDGIFAIAMTILVLELKVPEIEQSRSVQQLASELLHHGATFFSYLLSFLILGIFWYWHNRRYRYYLWITKSILVFELLQLAMAAFFPFCAALFGHYPFNALATTMYVGCAMIYRCAGHFEWITARKLGILSPDLTDEEYELHKKRGQRGSIILILFFAVNVYSCFGK